MYETAEEQPVGDELQKLIDAGDVAGLEAFLGRLAPADVARAVSRLDDESRVRMLAVVSPDEAAVVVERIPEHQAVEAMERIEPDVAAAILHEMTGSERADLLGEVHEPFAEAILGAMEGDEAAATRTLRAYAGDVTGGLMSLEYVAFPEQATVDDVLRDLRAQADRYRDFVVQYVFVTSADDRLVGVLRLRDLVFAAHGRRIHELMIRDPLSIRDTAALDEISEFFDSHTLFGAPVVDDEGRLVGMIRRDAISEALTDRSESDLLKVQGIVGGEELRTMPLLLRSRRRLSWLSVNIVLNVMAASVIALYQETLAAVIALAVFLPIISDMSGCSGNQAVAVSMRELSLGLVRPSELRRVWLKEVTVGMINGVALGVLIALVAWAWQGNPYLGLVVGLAMTLNTIVAVSIGGSVPLLLRRMGFDPALASSPILTTVTDMCGFFLLLGMASLSLPYLVAT